MLFEIPRLVRQIKSAKTVFIQLPEGLKPRATELVDQLKSHGIDCVISGDPCYGACDIRRFEKMVTVHFGHTPLPNVDNAKVIFVEYQPDLGVKDAMESAIKEIKGKRIGLLCVVQHINLMKKAKEILERNGKKVVIGKAKGRAKYDGQILGCDFSTAESVADKVDEFVIIASGVFHAIGVAAKTGKRVVRADPYTREAEVVTPDKWIKEKSLRLTKAMNAQRYGIVVSTKPGQMNYELALKTKKKLEKEGFKAYIIVLDLITPDTLLPYDVDAFVITACPRIVIDDWKNYKKALLLPDEV